MFFESKFYGALHSLEGRALSETQELSQRDYFHPEIFRSKVVSRVPVGKTGEKVEISVDPHQLVSMILPHLSMYLTHNVYGSWPKWCQRVDYFLSALPELTYEKNKKYKKREWPYRVHQKLYYFFDSTIKIYRVSDDIQDENRQRLTHIVEEFLECSSASPGWMRELWVEAKMRHNYTSSYEN